MASDAKVREAVEQTRKELIESLTDPDMSPEDVDLVSKKLTLLGLQD